MTPENTPRYRLTLKSALETGTTLAVLVASILVVRHVIATPAPPAQRARPEIRLPSSPVSLEGAKMKGSDRAKVVLIEYSDFQCPFCGRFAREVLPALEKEYVASGKIRLAFRHLPLKNIHSFAEPAAAATECAADQGKFWDLHDSLFRPTEWSPGRVAADVAGLRLDDKKYKTCIEGEALERVRADAATAAEFNIVATPAFLVGEIQGDGKVLIKRSIGGAQPLEQFRRVIEASLPNGG